MSKSVINYDENGNARSFVGREAVDVFAMAAIASALRLYAHTRLKANSAYTPRNMIAAATRYTGIQFKARDYLGAAAALSERVQTEKARIAALSDKANCDKCAVHYGDDGVCDEGKPVNSPHRAKPFIAR